MKITVWTVRAATILSCSDACRGGFAERRIAEDVVIAPAALVEVEGNANSKGHVVQFRFERLREAEAEEMMEQG